VRELRNEIERTLAPPKHGNPINASRLSIVDAGLTAAKVSTGGPPMRK